MTTQENITRQIKALNLSPDELKELLRGLVNDLWPAKQRKWQSERPYITENLQASPACGVLAYFRENGVIKVLMFKAGTHYARDGFYEADPEKPTYLIPGGFMELDQVRGSSHVEADKNRGEHPREGAVRELEEELVDDQGNPILKIDPARLVPLDFRTICPTKEMRHVGMSTMLELTREEVAVVKKHVTRLATDKDYRHAVRERTKNEDSNKPEACTATILPLNELAAGQHPLLYRDQESIFPILAERIVGATKGVH